MGGGKIDYKKKYLLMTGQYARDIKKFEVLAQQVVDIKNSKDVVKARAAAMKLLDEFA